jgi:malonyl CoA-acyl carrier protein transacylase
MKTTKKVWVFPGQGSQFKGMGADLFDRYPKLVAQADEVVGCSLRELCLEDPKRLLAQTQYTQPALFVVSALSFLQRRERHGAEGVSFAGHSLGEFNALHAAGAFDFETGVRLVTRRGQLMAQAPQGAMAAVIGLGEDRVRALVAGSEFSGIDIANVNAALQIVVSGPVHEIERCEPMFVAAGARYVRINVSAAFHSRYMRPVQDSFAAFVAGVSLRSLEAEVIANVTAQPYPMTDYAPLLVQQITQPVRWYESMSRLLARHELAFDEVGPGDVLTHLQFKIAQAPMPLRDEARSAPAGGRPRTVFMYSGQGSQYYGMGRELFEHEPAFREAMQACAEHYRRLTGRDLVGELYAPSRRHDELTELMLSHPALFSIGYALTQLLSHRGLRPDAVLGYSLGEYVAAVVAGVMSLEHAMAAVVMQARLVGELATGGAMLSILAPAYHLERHPGLYAGTTLASDNFEQNFVVSGPRPTLEALKRRLDESSIVSVMLPVAHAFHSAAMEPIRAPFGEFAEGIAFHAPKLPFYSAARGGIATNIDAEHFWHVARDRADFRRTVDTAIADGPCRFVDLGPSGTLATFIKHGYGGRVVQAPAINQFGRNLQSVSRLLEQIGR